MPTPMLRRLAPTALLAIAPACAPRVGPAGAPALRPAATPRRQAPAIDSAALARLVRAADSARSDAVVVARCDELVGDWRFGRPAAPIHAMSVTKAVLGLTVGRLVSTGALPSIDVPVARWYPEWRDGPHAAITVRHLLAHSSGLQDATSSIEVERSPDAVQLALRAEVVEPPGTRHRYNNKATNLVADLVRRVSGRSWDAYARDELFAPLGITDATWMRDSAGNVYGYAGLTIRPEHLLRLGQLVANEGTWRGRRLIDASWFADMRRGDAAEPRAALLWWNVPSRTTWVVDDARLAALAARGVDSTFLARAREVRGRWEGTPAYEAAMTRVFGEPYWEPMLRALEPAREDDLALAEYGPMLGFSASGYLGQFVYVYPGAGLVGVRMKRAPAQDAQRDRMGSFGTLLRELVPPGAWAGCR